MDSLYRKGTYVSIYGEESGKIYVLCGYYNGRAITLGIELTEFEDDIMIFSKTVPSWFIYEVDDSYVNQGGILAEISELIIQGAEIEPIISHNVLFRRRLHSDLLMERQKK